MTVTTAIIGNTMQSARRRWNAPGHGPRSAYSMSDEQPTVLHGHCHCGCGRTTRIALQTNTRIGHVKGQPVRYVRGHGNRRRVHYREEDRGYATPCWIWQLWRSKEGYGHMSDGTGRQRPAHRVMWENVNGPVPAGLQLDHLCRQPPCVNPDHLEPVTNGVNSRRGSTTKLDWPTVRTIRAELAQRTRRQVLADRFGVSNASIWLIEKGRNWPPEQDPGS